MIRQARVVPIAMSLLSAAIALGADPKGSSSAPATQPSATQPYVQKWEVLATEPATLYDAAVKLDGVQFQGIHLNQEIYDLRQAQERLNGVYLNLHELKFSDTSQAKAYLGIGVEPPDETVRAQLQIPDGVGLVVNWVDDNGPSKEIVQKHDILRKLDDQILINSEQLITLVGMHQQGESVSLTLIRQARPMTIQVKLGSKPADPQAINLNADKAHLDVLVNSYVQGSVPVLSDIPLMGRLFVTRGQPKPITFNDGELMASLDVQGSLTAMDVKSGNVLFHGPIGTKEQWQKVPTDIRQKLHAWQKLIAPDQKPHQEK